MEQSFDLVSDGRLFSFHVQIRSWLKISPLALDAVFIGGGPVI